MDTSLDTMVKFNKEDAGGLEGNLFPTTDLTAGELFRAELSECESRREAGMGGGDHHRFGLCHIPWGHPAVL